MQPHDFQVAATAWVAAVAAIIVSAGAAWVAVYPVISRMKRDIDALWAAHRAEVGGNDNRGAGIRSDSSGEKGDSAGGAGRPVR